jgi:hypothetical protein
MVMPFGLIIHLHYCVKPVWHEKQVMFDVSQFTVWPLWQATELQDRVA